MVATKTKLYMTWIQWCWHCPVVLALPCCHGNIIFPPIGAHSHIRGLGLDDALEPRPVSSVVQMMVWDDFSTPVLSVTISSTPVLSLYCYLVLFSACAPYAGVPGDGRAISCEKGSWDNFGDGEGITDVGVCV